MEYEAAIAERIEHYNNKIKRGVPIDQHMTYREVINDLSWLLKYGPEKWNPPRLQSRLDDVTMQPREKVTY